MKLLVGLGNPGSQYDKTRHNAGFLAVDRLLAKRGTGEPPRARFQGVAAECTIRGARCLVLKPTTYMNLSGRAVAEAVGFYKLDPRVDLLVLVDEAALPVGQIRLRPDGSAGGHNGLADIQRALGSDLYPRLRIGIGPRPPVMTLHDFVLGRFTPEDLAALEPALDLAAQAAEEFVGNGVESAMNKFNAKPAKAGSDP